MAQGAGSDIPLQLIVDDKARDVVIETHDTPVDRPIIDWNAILGYEAEAANDRKRHIGAGVSEILPDGDVVVELVLELVSDAELATGEIVVARLAQEGVAADLAIGVGQQDALRGQELQRLRIVLDVVAQHGQRGALRRTPCQAGCNEGAIVVDEVHDGI